MYCRLRSRWRKDSPDHRVDVDVKHIISLGTTRFLSYIWKDFLKMDIIGTLLPDLSKLWWDKLRRFRHTVLVIVLHLNATLENSMLCFHSNLSQRLSPYQYGLNSNCVLGVSPGLLEPPTQCCWTLIGSLHHWSSISQPHVHLLQVFLPASASSTWFQGY